MNHRIFTISHRIIWLSSVLIGIMASIPKFLTLHISPGDLAVDGAVAFLFSIFVWYLNIYLLPPYSTSTAMQAKFISRNLLISLLAGLPVMAVINGVYLLMGTTFDTKTLLLMWESRGVIINLTISLFIYLLYQAHLNKVIGIELEKIKADNLATQFEMLRQQVNPHFLFNSLNTLISMIEMQDQKASAFVLRLSEFYRSALERKKQDRVTVKEELAVMKAYCFLLEARFEEALVVGIDVEEKLLTAMIPPFTLQLLLENCVKHNVVSLDEPLRVRVYSEDNFIIVENDLQPKHTPEPSTGTGLNNIMERYRRSSDLQVEVFRDEKVFRVKLPVEG